jgi:hypothetical protein
MSLISNAEFAAALGESVEHSTTVESLNALLDLANPRRNVFEAFLSPDSHQGDSIAEIDNPDPFEVLAAKEAIFGRPIVDCAGEDVFEHMRILALLAPVLLRS